MKKIMALVLALVLCLSIGAVNAASAEDAPYQIVWQRYGSVGTDDAQAGLGMVQDAVNEWLANNGYNFTVDMMSVRNTDNVQLQLAAKDHIDIMWSNASTLTNTLLAGNFLYDIGGIYKDYEGLYNSMPENIWASLIRNGSSIYQIPTYKEAGLANAYVIKKSDAEKFGWEEIIANDPTRLWTTQDLEPYMAEAAETGEYDYLLYGTTMINGSREYPLLDTMAAITDYIGIDLQGDTAKVIKNIDVPSYQDYIKTMVRYNEAGYISEDFATSAQSMEKSWLFMNECLTPDFQANMDNKYSKYDPNGIYYMVMSNVYMTSNAALGSAFSIISYTEDIDACMTFMDQLYSNTELADLCLYGIEGTHYNRLEDGSCEKIADSGYKFPTWSCSNVMTVSLENTDSPDKKEQYAAFNASSIPSILLGYVFDTTAVDAQNNACNAVVKEFESLLQYGFLGEEGIEEYSAALDAAGVDAVIAEAQAQYDAFLASK